MAPNLSSDVRPAVIDEDVVAQLQDYLPFRHFLRHPWFVLNGKVGTLVADMSATLRDFVKKLRSLVSTLNTKRSS